METENHGTRKRSKDLSLTIGSTNMSVAKAKMIDGPNHSRPPKNKANHSKDVILIKQDVKHRGTGESGTLLYM